jgi:predicted hotdog family 3-hydroxylacyl-ACP dehydratase
MTIEISNLCLEDLLPHRGNMLLIDEILEVDETFAVTSAVINESFPLLSKDGVDPLIMVELAAQTAGVCNGLERIKIQGKDSGNMGWLVGVKRAQFFVDYIPLGTTIVTRSENVHLYENLREVSSVLHMDDTIIGELTLQLIKA